MPEAQDLEEEEGSDGPLVLVVEDNEKARSLRADGLSDIGCKVIPVDGAETALMVLRDGPSVDLIVTDIHLGTSSDDRGGVDLAQIVKSNYDEELPIAAYSGHYYEKDLTEEERDLFVERQTRGSLSVRQKRAFFRACKQHGLDHRRQRMERSGLHSRQLSASFTTKDFVFGGVLDQAEEVIASLGYQLRLLSSSSFAELSVTVAVWARATEDLVEVQVCGQPMLQWEGSDETEALQGLVAIMSGFAEDFRAMAVEPVGPAKRLRDFLDQVVVGGAKAGADS